jgi:hypothetical protein
MLLLPRGQLALLRPLVQSPPIAAQLLRDHRDRPPCRLQGFERVEEVLVGRSELSNDLGLDREASRGQQLPFTRDRRTDRRFKGRGGPRFGREPVRGHPHAQVRTVQRQFAFDGLA